MILEGFLTMKFDLFLKLGNAGSEFFRLSRIALLNARDGFVMRLIESLDFRSEACDLFIGLFEQKRIVSRFQSCANRQQYERCDKAPYPKLCHGKTPNEAVEKLKSCG